MPDLAVVQLSERERLVLIELARTASHQEIAQTLVVSINTVKTQVRSIYRKLGTRTRSETLAAALAHGFSLTSDAS
ncbi:helix-turn-helix transcriptional regulator [Actinotalea sp. BY-33]|uniref:Helix-turn-helix transcriptional regulator n=2 Tax=Actinotalea soli TaxID=2819234 RepID=A0A939LQ12_9CELL|nr:helix-turn-helix transcriptional regulator [Actinotalea soli]